MGERSLEIAGRVREGRVAVVDRWAVEKHYKVAQALAELMDRTPAGDFPVSRDACYEAYRNVCKIAAWMAGDTQAYEEEVVESWFGADGEGMLQGVETLLRPLLVEEDESSRPAR